MATPLTAKLLSLIVHDLRNPLNAVNLSLQVIDQEVPPGCPELQDDLGMLKENVTQLERMLRHLADYARLIEEPLTLRPLPFDPRRLLTDMVAEQSSRVPGGTASQLGLELRPGCPTEVELDQSRSHMAIHHLIANAVASAEGAPVRIVAGGGAGRLVVEAAVDRPPHPSTEPVALRPDQFERLMGTPAARVGLELGIVAHISELFGGTARLAVNRGQGTSVILEWPVRATASGGE